MTAEEEYEAFVNKIERQINFIEKWAAEIEPNRLPKSLEKHIGGTEKWLMAQFIKTSKEFHEAIEENELARAQRKLVQFWFGVLHKRNTGKCSK